MARAISVLGMHRSGTSTVTALMGVLGVQLGPGDQLGPPSFDNPKGFFEYNPFVHVNETLLQRAKASWHQLPDPMPDWASAQFEDLYPSVLNCVRDHFPGAAIWAFKDPRCCVTLPLWRRALPDLKEAVLVIRNPIEVADSLASRNGIPFEKSISLWLKYVSASLRNSQGMRRHVVFYTDFLDQLEEEVGHLRSFLELPELTTAQWQAAKDFVVKDLRHHHRSREELDRRPDIPQEVGHLFRGLRAYANLSRKGGVQPEALDHLLDPA